MLFNSLDFAIFLPIVFLLYWFIMQRNLRLQNAFIVIASYVFYGWWDWRFLSLLLFSSLVDYFVGLGLQKEQRPQQRKILLVLSIICNLGLLGFFKYYNFFVDSFAEAFSFFGMPIQTNSLNIILPVGISFYTFQSLSYGIDVYRRKLEPTHDVISFLAFVSFFPQLVAGPIERATHLLPQFYTKRHFDYARAVDGMRQILWGLFKKMVIADNCAQFVDTIFNGSATFSGSTLLLGAFLFALQIYGDFSGYSDIAIGTSRLFGFDLQRNFAFPYFSRDIAEFWRRWHISLSTWFRDYLYVPLGGSRGSKARVVKNTFITFLLSGFWHGANWKFIAWGALHAIYFLPLLLLNKNRSHLGNVAPGRIFPTAKEFTGILITFLLTVLAWIFFRANDINHAGNIFSGIFSSSLFTIPEVLPRKLLLLITFALIVEWLGRENLYAIERSGLKWPRYARRGFYYFLLLLIFFEGGREQPFIYFQF
ncbi:MAG TPA: MBOAT family O-acyltransferase [Chitinophagaceae bacterium]|nr:MBOAT family O-acyltransferase [Chitinophagaceae bacterium]